ncbi:MAG: type VI secretion system baseplate subunit TssE [Aquabacterium sp.]|uniref:type VI secretion system baseplate subunit TssE n=1 Tax=Aquabacterium sp. TaxID=1872578 RepID=UPI003BAEF7DC
MAELTTQERLQPSLLDRLTDEAPGTTSEPPQARVLTRQQLRAAVLRDLSWLFNANRAEPSRRMGHVQRSPQVLAELALWQQCPMAQRSVLNFGLPSLSGESIGKLDLRATARDIEQAIIDFEPRIDPQTLEVDVQIDGSAREHHNQLKLVIRGHMWNQPVPLELLLSAAMDVETGQSVVRDLRS